MGTLTNSQSFTFGDSNCKFCSQLPRRHPKNWHSDVDISDLGYIYSFYGFVFEWKILNLLDIQDQCIHKLGKIQSELKLIWCLLLIFKVVYWVHLTQLLPSPRDFVGKGQQLVWVNFFATCYDPSCHGCCLPWQCVASWLMTRQWGRCACSDYSCDGVLKLTDTAISHVQANKSHPQEGESFLYHLTLFYKSVTCF